MWSHSYWLAYCHLNSLHLLMTLVGSDIWALLWRGVHIAADITSTISGPHPWYNQPGAATGVYICTVHTRPLMCHKRTPLEPGDTSDMRSQIVEGHSTPKWIRKETNPIKFINQSIYGDNLLHSTGSLILYISILSMCLLIVKALLPVSYNKSTLP